MHLLTMLTSPFALTTAPNKKKSGKCVLDSAYTRQNSNNGNQLAQAQPSEGTIQVGINDTLQVQLLRSCEV